jgi:hypothetical protein
LNALYFEIQQFAGGSTFARWQIRFADLSTIPDEPSLENEVNVLISRAKSWENAWNNHAQSSPLIQSHENQKAMARIGTCLLRALILQRQADEHTVKDGFYEGAFFGGFCHIDIRDQMPWQ